MNSVLLSAATRFIAPIQLVFSIFLLLRGHNEPGGGFIGGLVAASAFALYAIARDVPTARRRLYVPPQFLIATGLLIALLSGLPGLFLSEPFMSGLWFAEIPLTYLGLGILKIGTPFIFDIGVFLVVMGITLLVVFGLVEDN